MKKVSVVLFAFALSFSACTKCAECSYSETDDNGNPIGLHTEKYCGEELQAVQSFYDCN